MKLRECVDAIQATVLVPSDDMDLDIQSPVAPI
jgi:hypothetical protein